VANLIITIDGPAASGKSTMAKLLAERIGASFLDTGAMYRAVTLAAMQAGVDMSNEEELLGVLAANKFEFAVKEGKTVVFINGADFTEQIRDPKVTANARYVASAARMREKLVEMQRQFAAKEKRIVTEGRDQGTVAFPDADIKFYLTADINERARRRQAELLAKGDKANLAQIRKAIEDRDESDRSRASGPMIPAKDGIVVDTTSLSIEGVVKKLFGYVEKKCLKK
jgi:cytidylate kinase